MWACRCRGMLNSHTPSRLRTNLEGGKKGMNEKIKLERDLEQACGSTPKPWFCTGPRHMENFMMNKMNSITEAVNGAWGILYEDQEWIPQNSIQRQECEVLKSSHCDIEVPCVVQWRMLWYSAPTSLKNDSLNDGVIHEKCDKAVNMAIKTCFTCPFWRRHTPKIFLLGRHRS